MDHELTPAFRSLSQRGRVVVLESPEKTFTKWRIIYAHPLADRVCWIRLQRTETAIPTWESLTTLRLLHDAARLLVAKDDPFRQRSQRKSARDARWSARWQIVQMVLAIGELYYLASSKTRALVIAQVVTSLGVTPLAVRRAMTRYYLFGMESAALVSQYDRCGAPADKRRIPSGKRGRPRFIPPERLT